MKRPELTELPPLPPAGERSASTVASLFNAGLARSTLLLWAAFFLLMFGFYFALSWTPKLLVSAGLSAREGITGGSLFGLLVARLDLGRLTAASLAITALAMAAFGAATGHLGASFAIAFLIGGFIFGSMAGLYAFAPVIYPAAVRTTGMGWAIGIGRIGAILAPLIAGMLLDRGWQPPHLSTPTRCRWSRRWPPSSRCAAVPGHSRPAA